MAISHVIISLLTVILLLIVYTYGNYLVNEDQWFELNPPQSITTNMNRDNIGFGLRLEFLRKSSNESSLLVSDPYYHHPIDRFQKRGVVYECNIENLMCRIVSFTNPVHLPTFSVSTVDFTNALFGVTLATSEKWIMACAPNLKHKFNLSNNHLRMERPNDLDMPGLCQLIDINQESVAYLEPPGLVNWERQNFNREGFGMFGFSAVFAENSKRIISTSPGSYYFQGQVHSFQIPDITSNVYHKIRPKSFPNIESDEFSNDWCYRGYSVAVGNFDGDNLEDVVTAVPKLNNYAGAVEIFDSELNLLAVLRGDQPGAYFGGSLLVMDINGDNLDDIIIGSPMFSCKKGLFLPECGKVDVYVQTIERSFIHSNSIFGSHRNGRFGSSLSNIGDINGDGFLDVAISEPYSENGIVSIYQGSPYGLATDTNQILKPRENVKLFGIGLPNKLKIEKDKVFPVGAVQSNGVVIIIRKRPIVNIKKGAFFNPTFISARQDQTNIIFNITICLRYNDIDAPDSLLIKTISVLDAMKPNDHSRLILTNNDTNADITLIKHRLVCVTHNAKLKDQIRDKLTPLKFIQNFSIVHKSNSEQVPLPTLNESVSNKVEFEIPIENNCGDDRICIPDLSVYVLSSQNRTFDFASRQPLKLVVYIENKDEDAFEAKCIISMPDFVEIVQINRSMEHSIWCSYHQLINKTALLCELGNPMVTNQKHKLVIFIRPRNVHRLPKNFYVTINASSKNSEEFNTMADNVVKINISVQAKYNIELSGHTEHDQLHWNNTKYVPTSLKRLSDIGPVVEHIYKIKNNGAFNIDLLNVQIKWPSYYSTFPEQHLLYLTTPPKLQRRFLEFDTNDFCTVHSAIVGKAAVNPLGLTKNAKSGFTSADHNSKAPKLATRIRRFINRQQYGEYTTTINCHVSNLQASQQLNILVRSRAWLHNYTNKSANIVAKSTCTITHPVHTSHGSTLQQYKTSIFTIIFIGEQLPLSKLPDLWMVTCAAGVGLILLLAIITALWSCGFFKRIRIHHKEFKINNSNQNISPSKYIEQSENFYPNSVAGTLNSFRYFDKDAEINHGHYYNKTDGCFQKATFL